MSEPRDLAPRDLAAALDLAEAVKPLFAGKPPHVQGVALAELLSLWLAGHHPAQREDLLILHIDTVWQLVEVNAPPLDAFWQEMNQ